MFCPNRSQCLLFLRLSYAGDPLGWRDSAGEERHAAAAGHGAGQHTLQRARLLRLPQHQRDLQTHGAARQHSHETAAGQQGLRAGPLSAQTQEEDAQESVGPQKVCDRNTREDKVDQSRSRDARKLGFGGELNTVTKKYSS